MQPIPLTVGVEDITFEACEAAALRCGRYETAEDIEMYAHQLEAEQGDYRVIDYLRDRGFDGLVRRPPGIRDGGDNCGYIPAWSWLEWVDEEL